MQKNDDPIQEYDVGSQTTSTKEGIEDFDNGPDLVIDEELYESGKPRRTIIRAKIIRDEE
jgi:hypothetical protein